jgi:hypothetical protein
MADVEVIPANQLTIDQHVARIRSALIGLEVRSLTSSKRSKLPMISWEGMYSKAN